MQNLPRFLPTFGLLFGATVWGIIWYPYRLLEEAGISGAAASVATYFFALLIGGIVFMRGWRHLRRVPSAIIPLALAAGWTNLAYVLAVIDGEVMRVLLLFYLSPLWTLLLSHLLLDERTGRRGVAVIAISLTGAFIMLWHPESPPLPQNFAEWLALSAGVGFALTNVLTRRAVHLTLAAKSFAVWGGVVVLALLLLPFSNIPAPAISDVTGQQWLLMAALGGILMLTTLLVQYGITHTLVTRASVIFLFELVVAALSSWWLANEAMTLREWLGGTLIVAAAVFAPQGD
jgi:drug/metabolite transporter (DMT)-like permease